MNNSSTTGEIIEDKFYSVGAQINALYITDLQNGKRKYIDKAVPDEEWNKNYFGASAKINNEIWFFPFSGNTILIFDVVNKTKEYIDVLEYEGFDFICAIEKDDFFWLIPFDYPYFVKVSIKDRKVIIIDSIIESKDKYLKQKYYGAVDCGDYLIITPGSTKSIFKLFIKDCTTEEIKRLDNSNSNYIPNLIGGKICISSTISSNPIYVYENNICSSLSINWGKNMKFAYAMFGLDNKLILFEEETCDAYFVDFSGENFGTVEFDKFQLRTLITSKKYKDSIFVFSNRNEKTYLKCFDGKIECVPIIYEECFDLKMLLYDMGVIND